MRQLFLAIFIVSIGTTTAFAQTSAAPPTDSAVKEHKFYFPASYYSDSVTLNGAIPKLAEEVLAVYHEKDKRTFFVKSIPLCLASGNYGKASDFVDSVRRLDGNNSYGVALKSYSLAKIAEQKQKGSFDDAFRKEYSEAFDQLSFRKKVRAAWVDPSWLKNDSTELATTREKIREKNKDSITLEDGRALCEHYFKYSFDKKIIPLTSALIGNQYRSTFPAIKSASWAGVAPVQPIDEKPDPSMQYKLLFELTGFALKGEDSSAKTEINIGLCEVARQINLHEANGIPRKNIHVVVVTHASAMYCFFTNEKYKKKYGIDNPNIALIKELQDYGVKMLVCGQAMTFFNLEMEDLVPGIKQVLTAQTVISSYQLKGYVYYDMSLRE
jgi:intracellular sulfur oxidation DsrE/DsrF family protein